MSTQRLNGRKRWLAAAIIATFGIAVAASAAIGWRYAREAPPHQGPIVVIAVDSMRGDAIAPGPRPGSDSPAIDALAADSVLFTRAYTHSTARLPAYASIATGQLPFEHGVRDDGGFVLANDARTMAELLRGRGFVTGGAASTFLLRRESGLGQGFDFYDVNLSESTVDPAVTIGRDGLQTYEAAEEWIRTRGERRYFLTLDVDGASAESVVARLINELKARQLYEEATVVLTATRGGQASGSSLDEAMLRVPLLVKLPFREGAGRAIGLPVQHIDLLPTLLDFVRAPIPGGLRGQSLRPLLDADNASLDDRPIYTESLEALLRFGGYPVYGITRGDARLTRGATDRYERSGVSPSSPDVSPESGNSELAAQMTALIQAGPALRPAPVLPGDVRRFAAVGYLAGLRDWSMDAPALSAGDQRALVEAHRAGVRRMALGDWAAGIAALRAIARTHPMLPVVQYQLGIRLLEAGRPADAMGPLKVADLLRQDDPEIATALAMAALKGQRIAEAETFVEQALARAADSDTTARVAARVVALEVALASKDNERAAIRAAEIEREDPTMPLSDYVEGRIAFDEQRFDDAVAALQNAVRALQDKATALADLHLVLGDALAQVDKVPEAEAAYRQELLAFPGNLRAFVGLAALLQATGRKEAMAQTLDALIEAVPTPEGYAAAARAWTSAGNRAKATALRNEARRRFRGDLAFSVAP